VWHGANERAVAVMGERHAGRDAMQGSLLGPEFSTEDIRVFLTERDIPFVEHAPDELATVVARLLADEQVVGWFQGRMEFGPRALGARSILGDPRSTRMQSTLNLKIKHRESFRPFAPAVLRDQVAQYFDLDCDSPYMLLVARVREDRCVQMTPAEESLFGIDRLNVPRSTIPAVTHVDYSARVQTVDGVDNPPFHALLTAFHALTGCPVLVNTSFNVRGEPIVCTPEDAFRCFMRTEMDYLALGNFVLDKRAQAPVAADERWKEEFALD